jgi:hypothetical protein
MPASQRGSGPDRSLKLWRRKIGGVLEFGLLALVAYHLFLFSSRREKKFNFVLGAALCGMCGARMGRTEECMLGLLMGK